MLDDEDLDFTVLVTPFNVVGLIIVVIIAVMVWANHEECASRSCPAGQSARLLDHACLCVQAAK